MVMVMMIAHVFVSFEAANAPPFGLNTLNPKTGRRRPIPGLFTLSVRQLHHPLLCCGVGMQYA